METVRQNRVLPATWESPSDCFLSGTGFSDQLRHSIFDESWRSRSRTTIWLHPNLSKLYSRIDWDERQRRERSSSKRYRERWEKWERWERSQPQDKNNWASPTSTPTRWGRLPAGSPEPRSNISANIWAMKKFGTALERACRAAFKSVEGQRWNHRVSIVVFYFFPPNCPKDTPHKRVGNLSNYVLYKLCT